LAKKLAAIAKQIYDQGVDIAGCFKCDGQFMAMIGGHPDREDQENARQFVLSMFAQEYFQFIRIQPVSSAVEATNLSHLPISKNRVSYLKGVKNASFNGLC
jgi:hypothetical protein